MNTTLDHPMQRKIEIAIPKVLGISMTDIISRMSKRHINYARNMFCYFMRKETDATFEETGLLIGGRTRGTTFRSVSNIEELSSVYDWVQQDINNIKLVINDN